MGLARSSRVAGGSGGGFRLVPGGAHSDAIVCASMYARPVLRESEEIASALAGEWNEQRRRAMGIPLHLSGLIVIIPRRGGDARSAAGSLCRCPSTPSDRYGRVHAGKSGPTDPRFRDRYPNERPDQARSQWRCERSRSQRTHREPTTGSNPRRRRRADAHVLFSTIASEPRRELVVRAALRHRSEGVRGGHGATASGYPFSGSSTLPLCQFPSGNIR